MSNDLDSEAACLPDFKGVKNFDDITKEFYPSACSIMSKWCIINDRIPGVQFHITSLELYLQIHNNPNVWNDPAIDEDERAKKEQKNRATWYVRQKKGHRYWRMDITAGDQTNQIQAGLLIRQIDGKGGRNPGPATALCRMVLGSEGFREEKWTENEMSLLDQIHGKRIDGSDGSLLRLVRQSTPQPLEFGIGVRINIPIKKLVDSNGEKIKNPHLRVSVRQKYSSDFKYTPNMG